MRQISASQALNNDHIDKLLEPIIECSQWEFPDCLGQANNYESSHRVPIIIFSEVPLQNWQHLAEQF